MYWTEMKILRWMCGVYLRNRLPSAGLRERKVIELVFDVVKRNRRRWLGHVLRKDYGDCVKKNHVIRGGKCERETRWRGLKREEAQEGDKSGNCCGKTPANPCVSRENGRKNIVVVVVVC